jgi:hypothetical protein
VLLAYDRLEAIAGAGLNRSRSINDRGDFGQVWSVRVKVTASGGADPMRMHANDGNDGEEDDEKDLSHVVGAHERRESHDYAVPAKTT